MKKVFISTPFSGKTEEEVEQSLKNEERRYLLDNCPEAIFVSFESNYWLTKRETLMAEAVKHPKLYYLGLALQKMADCDEVIFSDDWETAKGCQIEHLAYDLYIKDKQP